MPISTIGANGLNRTEDFIIDGLTVGQGSGNVATNTVVGSSALPANTTGANNVAVGFSAAYSNTTGTDNLAIGYNALYSNATGGYNVAIGRGTLNGGNVSNGVAVGYQALNSTSGGNNTAVGYQAGYTNATGAGNTFVGLAAGYSSTGNDNTLIGAGAGYFTTGNANTFIGRGASGNGGGAITTGSKNTIIGAYTGNNGGLDIRTANNYIVLSDGDGNPRIYHDGAALRYFRGLSSSPSFDYVSQSYKTISRSVTTSFLQIDTNSTSSSGLFCNFEIMYLFDDFGQNIYTGRKTYRLYNDSGGTVQLNLVSSEDYGIVPTLSIVRNSTYSVTLRVNTATTASTYGWMYRIRILAYNNATSTQTGQILTFTEV